MSRLYRAMINKMFLDAHCIESSILNTHFKSVWASEMLKLQIEIANRKLMKVV
ncbi:hypothetical protein D3C76_1745500 [compost metagenome]